MLDDLILKLAEFRHDPLGYVRWAFPWGEPGELEGETLRAWQEDQLAAMTEHLKSQPWEPLRMATATGHGVGKSALVGMITDWAFNTCVDTRGVITANTENQLKTKTWVEIAKWHRLSIARQLATLRATSLRSADPVHEDTWRIDIVPWSENNTEAFAGLHNKRKRIYLCFDEASAIHDSIHEVAEGALTDEETEIIWLQYGNPTRNRGRFRDTAPDGKFGKRWRFRSLDSRTVEGTNLKQIKEWEQDYGEDSDFFKVRVRGLFPDADGDSFISRADAVAAIHRKLPEENTARYVIGVDIGRAQGGDPSVIYPRRGRDARSVPPKVYWGQNSIEMAYLIRDEAVRLNAEAIFVDETGMGVGVVDNLRNMQLSILVIGVNFGAGADGYAPEECLNKRAEIYSLLRQDIRNGLCIPEYLPSVEHTFVDELTATGYGFASKVKGRSDAIQLQAKKDVKRESGFSPDFTDALATTYAMPLIGPRALPAPDLKPSVSPDYHPLEVSW